MKNDTTIVPLLEGAYVPTALGTGGDRVSDSRTASALGIHCSRFRWEQQDEFFVTKRILAEGAWYSDQDSDGLTDIACLDAALDLRKRPLNLNLKALCAVSRERRGRGVRDCHCLSRLGWQCQSEWWSNIH